MAHALVTYDFGKKEIICEGTLEQCAVAMLDAEKADPDGASVEVGHWEDNVLKPLFGGELSRLRKLLAAG